MARIVIAPDSFKGSISSRDAARAIAQGWLDIRPDDEVIQVPYADGGEGSLAAIEQSRTGSVRVHAGKGYWLYLPEGIAVVELAQVCGITLLEKLDPMNTHTYELGVLLSHAALDKRVKKIYVALGGSASTDAGFGALMSLGYKFLDIAGQNVQKGGAYLLDIVHVDSSNVISPPPEGVVALVDVQSPLLGEYGAAAIYGPQKGATDLEIEMLELGLRNFLSVSGCKDGSGNGAAGGTSFGLGAFWGATFSSGAQSIAEIIGLPQLVADADLVITGEGRLDSQSFVGKGVGFIYDLSLASKTEIAFCVGSNSIDFPDNSAGVSIRNFAQDLQDAITQAARYLREGGSKLAGNFHK